MKRTLRRVRVSSLALAGASALVACNAIIGAEDRYFADVGQLADATMLDAGAGDASLAVDAAAADAATADVIVADAPSVEVPDAADSGLLAFWTFDEDGGAVAHDGTGHGHDLAVTNGATIGGAGYFGTGALQYMPAPTSGQATCASLSGAGFPPVGTLSMWGYFDTVTSDQQRGIFDYFDDSRHHFYLAYYPNNFNGDGGYSVDFYQQFGGDSSAFEFQPKIPMRTGGWVHWVIVWDTVTSPASVQLYIDEKLPAAVNISYAFGSLPFDESFIFYNGFGGSYDDIYLWSRALSSLEVASLPTK